MRVTMLNDYEKALRQWMHNARLLQEWAPNPHARFDALLTWKAPGGKVRYLVEEKHHLRNQDARVVAEQLKRLRHLLPKQEHRTRLLLVAPYIRPTQAGIFEEAGVDYLDLAGNVHLQAPGFFVHVEGRQPPKDLGGRPIRINKGWVKTVMALLVAGELVHGPYRALAPLAGVALGTVAGCLDDLTARGLLQERLGKRYITDRTQLVALWVQAYIDVQRPRLAERRYEVRADAKTELLDRLVQVLAKHRVAWGLTGAAAAEQLTRFFRVEETEMYAPLVVLDDRAIQKELIAQPTARTGNLLVIEPPGPLALPTTAVGQIPLAPELLTYAELRYRGTAQALEAAEILLPKVLATPDHASH